MLGSKKGHPVGCPALLLFGDLALVFGDGGRQLLEVRLDEAGLVEGDQSAPVDALREFVGGRLDLMAGELSNRVVQAPEVSGLVLAVRRMIPEQLDLVHIAVSDDLGLGQVVEDRIPLLMLDRSFSQAVEDSGTFLEALDGSSYNFHKARNVQLVRMLLGQRELVRKSLQAIGADQSQDAHLKRNTASTVEGVVQRQAQAQIVAHLGHLDQLVLEVVLDVYPRTVADNVSLASEVAQLVVGKSRLNRFDQGAILNKRVAFSANAQHLFGIGAAVSHPTGRFALWSQERDRLDGIVEVAGCGDEGCFGRNVDFVHE